METQKVLIKCDCGEHSFAATKDTLRNVSEETPISLYCGSGEKACGHKALYKGGEMAAHLSGSAHKHNNTEVEEKPKAPAAPATAPEKVKASEKSGNWFTRWLKDEDKGCFDKKDDGKISFGEKMEYIGKGLIEMLKGAINNPITTLVSAAAVAGITVATGGAALPFVLGAGVVFGGAQIAYGAGKLANASTDTQAQDACESMGNGAMSLILSAIGFKSFAKAKGTYIKNTRSKAAKLLRNSKDPIARKDASKIMNIDNSGNCGNLRAHQKFNAAHPDMKAPIAAKASKPSFREKISNWFADKKEAVAAEKRANTINDNLYRNLNKGNPIERNYLNGEIASGKIKAPSKPSFFKRIAISIKEKFYNLGTKATQKSAKPQTMTVGEAKANLRTSQQNLQQAEAYLKNAKIFGGTRDAEAQLKNAQNTLKVAEEALATAKKAQKVSVLAKLKTRRVAQNKPSILERGIEKINAERTKLNQHMDVKSFETNSNIQDLSAQVPQKPISTTLKIQGEAVKGNVRQLRYKINDKVLAGEEKVLSAADKGEKLAVKAAGKVSHGLEILSAKINEGGRIVPRKLNLAMDATLIREIPLSPASIGTVPPALFDISTKPGMIKEELAELAVK